MGLYIVELKSRFFFVFFVALVTRIAYVFMEWFPVEPYSILFFELINTLITLICHIFMDSLRALKLDLFNLNKTLTKMVLFVHNIVIILFNINKNLSFRKSNPGTLCSCSSFWLLEMLNFHVSLKLGSLSKYFCTKHVNHQHPFHPFDRIGSPQQTFFLKKIISRFQHINCILIF